MNDAREPLIILTGPTAVGKTSLSLKLAEAVDGEIISADSMQVYKGMDIGSAKASPEERARIPHHLLDILEPWEEFHVVLFQEKCREAIREIRRRGKLPILTGGTGFYIQAVLKDVDFSQGPQDETCRRELEQLAAAQGPAYLHTLLAQADPEAAAAIHPNNQKRVIRALEFYRLTGEKISRHNRLQASRENAYNACYFVLDEDREILYRRIEQRVDRMLEQGLVEEVKKLKEAGCTRDMVSMQGLGYKEILDCLEGDISLDEAVYRIKRDTRHFAKRQLTWFRRERDVIWVSKPAFGRSEERILAFLIQKLQDHAILPPQPCPGPAGSQAQAPQQGPLCR